MGGNALDNLNHLWYALDKAFCPIPRLHDGRLEPKRNHNHQQDDAEKGEALLDPEAFHVKKQRGGGAEENSH